MDSQKSTVEYIFMLCREPLSQMSKLQGTVALSSTKAEYGNYKAGKEALLILRFLAHLRFRLLTQLVDLRADNKRAISLIKNPEFYRQTKYIQVRWHWIREKIERNEIVITYISTKKMLADGLTKALGPMMFKDFRRMIGMT